MLQPPSSNTARQSRWRTALDTIATVLVILVALSFLVNQGRAAAPRRPPLSPNLVARANELRVPQGPVSLADTVTAGSASAPLALVIYSDFQCPFCGRFARDTMPLVDKEYVKSGKVQIAFHNLPLTSIHSLALDAAKYAVCAAQQGKFWAFHDIAFHDQPRLSEAQLGEWSRRAGIDDAKLRRCLTDFAPAAVERESKTAKAVLVSGTPTVFVGIRQPDGSLRVARRMSGAVPFARLKEVLDPLVARGGTHGTSQQ